MDSEVSYGVMDSFDMETDDFDYYASVEVELGAEPPQGMLRHTVPEQTYAVFKCTLPNIHDEFRYAYREWFPASEYERAQGPEFELYNAEFHVDQTMYLYIPVKSA
jgi:AraC family transcriptional regulator